MRSARRETPAAELPEPAADRVDAGARRPSPAAKPDELDELLAALARLTPDHRAVVVLRYVGDLSPGRDLQGARDPARDRQLAPAARSGPARHLACHGGARHDRARAPRRLRRTPLPGQSAGLERAWPVVRAARADTAAARRPPSAGAGACPASPALLAACALVLAALVLATGQPPPGGAGPLAAPGHRASACRPPTARRSPGSREGDGCWSRRAPRAGWSRRTAAATCSAATPARSSRRTSATCWPGAGPTLTAFTPGGRPQWSLSAPATVSDARWSARRLPRRLPGRRLAAAWSPGTAAGTTTWSTSSPAIAPAWQPGTARRPTGWRCCATAARSSCAMPTAAP